MTDGTKITVSFDLEMSDKDLHAWANEYGLDMSEVANDARGHLGELILAQLKGMMHVEEFTSLRNYQVK